MKLTRKTVSKQFRLLVSEHYPGIRKNPAYWGLFEYLLFGCKYDKHSGRLLITQKTLAKIENKEARLNNNEYIAQDLLAVFQRDVMTPDTFQWSKWKHSSAICRQVTLCKFTYEFDLLRIQEQQKVWHHKGRVYFRDGSKFSRAKQAKEREELGTEASLLSNNARCLEAKLLLGYLNELPPHLFNKMLANLDAARLVAHKIYASPKDEIKRNHALNTLDSIEDQAKPFYQPSSRERTVRIFTLNESLLLLPRRVRDELTKDWVSMDLRSSQLAICAFTWDVPLAKEFLNTGGTIWEMLFNRLGLDYSLKESNSNLFEDIKQPLKKALYSVMYGMGARDVSRLITNALKRYGVTSAGPLFRSHPLISALFKARDEQMKKINSDGGAVDCFGNSLKISSEMDAKSILAQLSKATELNLLFPVVNLALNNPDAFKITVWLHDGFSVAFLKSSKRSLWMKKIQVAVKNRAVELGIPTVLEVH